MTLHHSFSQAHICRHELHHFDSEQTKFQLLWSGKRIVEPSNQDDPLLCDCCGMARKMFAAVRDAAQCHWAAKRTGTGPEPAVAAGQDTD